MFLSARRPASYGGAFDELYDLALDPFELDNRFADEGYASRVERLHSLLDEILATIPNNRR